MQRKRLLATGAILVVLLSCLILLVPNTSVQAQNKMLLATPGPAFTATAVLDQAATAVAVADRTANEVSNQTASTQNILNYISFLSVILPALLALAATILGLLGFSRLRDFEKRAEVSTRKIEDTRKEIDKKREDIDELQRRLIHDAENTNKIISYLILSNQLVEEKKNDQAIQTLKRALLLRSHDPQLNYALGRMYSGIGSYDTAIDSLKKALEADEEMPQAHMELGLAYRFRADAYYKDEQEEKRFSEYNQAIYHLKRAYALLPGYEVAISSLAGTYRRLKMYQTSLYYYQMALEANPESSYAPGNIGLLAYHEGKMQIALPAFKQTKELAVQLKSLDGPQWDYYDLGMSTLVLKEGKLEAIAAYEKAIERTRNSTEFRSVLDGLTFLQEVEDKYPIEGLDSVITLVKEAKAKMEAKEKAIEQASARLVEQIAAENRLALPIQDEDDTGTP